MAKIDNFSIQTKKARKKYFSENISLNLIRYNPKSLLIKAYWNTYHCAEYVYSEDGKTTKSTYCKNRWCPTCQSIRVATLINQYSEALGNLKDTYFVTLTKPTVESYELDSRIKYMTSEWRKISELARLQKRQLKGVRKAECTFTNGKYHYHYHIVVEGKSNADWILAQWLKRNPDSNKIAQSSKKCDEMKLIELFKYVTKLSFKATGKHSKSDKSLPKSVQFKALDTIFMAMRGKRVYNSFGIKKINEDETIVDDIIGSPLQEHLYKWYKTDWFNVKTGKEFSGYKPTETINDWFNEFEEQ